MFELKPLSASGVPAALEKAFRYRMLNQPEQAESIYQDILAVAPDHPEAVVGLILAITDRFAEPRPESPAVARELLPRLADEFDREYYAGIICERLALARMRSGFPHCGEVAFDFFREAMAHYEKAEAVRPEGNDDPILRWNSCARIVMGNRDVRPEAAEAMAGVLGE